MGGLGSGSYIRINSSRDVVEANYRLDVRKLARKDCLQPGSFIPWAWFNHGEQAASIGIRVKEDCIVLSYKHQRNSGEWTDVEQTVRLDRTPCNFGGYRYWFRCPGCYRRVAILYAAGKYFLCRHCHGLTYRSSQEADLDRLMRKARKFRQRIGASKSLIDPILFKPKNMHQETFDKLRIEALRVENKINHVMAAQLGIRI